MRYVLVFAFVFLLLLIAIMSVRVGAAQPAAPPPNPDLHTYVFVRELRGVVQGADVVFRRISDSEIWIFPRTGLTGSTKRQIPDGVYIVSVKADGYVSKLVSVRVPARGQYAFRDYTIWLERVR